MRMSEERTKWISAEFERRFGGEPSIWAQAPGRVDLMGSHTDYNEGFVLTMAIDRDTWIAARPRPDRRVRLQSLNLQGAAAFSLDDIQRDTQAPWSNYVRGVADVLQKEGYALCGFDGLIHSTVPISSGLSSSAALEVAAARLFQALCGLEMDAVRLALLCQKAENQFVGMNCGILDQYTASVCLLGSALLLDCRRLSHEMVDIHPAVRIVICDTRAKRELTGSEYPERRAACEKAAAVLGGFYPEVKALRDATLEMVEAHAGDLPEAAARRARFILQENQRVLDLAQALPAGDRAWIHKLAADSFAGARDSYEIVSSEMEKMMSAMLGAPGAMGARQAGAGFGGCMVAFVESDQVNAFAAHVQQAYVAATGIQPQVYIVR